MDYYQLTEIDRSIKHLSKLVDVIEDAYYIQVKFSKSNYIPGCPLTGASGMNLGKTEVRVYESNKDSISWGFDEYYFPKDSFRESIINQVKREIVFLETKKEKILNKKWYQFWL